MEKIQHKTLVSALLILALVSCNANSDNKAYRQLYLSKYAIDFPQTRAQYDRCRQKPVEPCRKLIEKAEDGKRRILSMGSSRAIEAAFNTIQEYCPDGSSEDEELCKGAIISLFLFDDEEKDRQIRALFTQLPQTVQSEIFGQSPYAWFSNRPQAKPWIQIIQSLPEVQLSTNDKNAVIQIFTHKLNLPLGGVSLLSGS
jgi:hypothetical protein